MSKNQPKIFVRFVFAALVFASFLFPRPTMALADESSVANCFSINDGSTSLCRDWWGGGDGGIGGGSHVIFMASSQKIVSGSYCPLNPIDMSCIEKFLRLPTSQGHQSPTIRFEVAVPACSLASTNPVCISEISLDYGQGFEKLHATRSFYGSSFLGAASIGIPAGGVQSVWAEHAWKIGQPEYGMRSVLSYEAKWNSSTAKIEVRKVKSSFALERYAASTDATDPSWNFGSRRIALDAKSVEMKFSLPRDFGGWMIANMSQSKVSSSRKTNTIEYTISGTVAEMGLVVGPKSLGSQMLRDWPTDFSAISTSTNNKYSSIKNEWRFNIFQSADECVLGNDGISGIVTHNAPYMYPGAGSTSFFDEYQPRFDYDSLIFDFASLGYRPDGSAIATDLDINLDPRFVSCKFGLSNALINVTLEDSLKNSSQSQIAGLDDWLFFHESSIGGVENLALSARDARTSDLSLTLKLGSGSKLTTPQLVQLSNFFARTTKATGFSCKASGASPKDKTNLLKISKALCAQSRATNPTAHLSAIWSNVKAKFSSITVRASY